MRRAIPGMSEFFEIRGMDPIIDAVYAFEDAHRAYEHLARGRQTHGRRSRIR